MKAADTFFLGKILVFGVALPTVDTFSDLLLAGKLFQSGHTLWAIAVILPVLFNFFFIVIAFRQFPFPPWHHRYISVAILLLQGWPQYLYLGIAHEFLLGGPDWLKKRDYYMRNISTFEPFIESISQLIIKLCIWTFFLQDHLEKFQGDENPLFKETWEQHFFYFTTCVSALASVLGIIRFFKDGPVRFLPQSGLLNGVFTYKFIFTFLAILCSVISKILLLISLLYYSLGVLAVFSDPPSGLELVGTVSQPECSNITIVQACSDDAFQVRTHFPDEKYNEGVPWASPEPEWRVFLRDEGTGVRIFWNANKSEWWEGTETCLTKWTFGLCEEELPNNCGGAGESIKMYCSESVNIVTLSRLLAFGLWFGLNILPQFVLATLVLLSVDVKGTFRAFLHFPELVLSPTITNFMFGPKNIFCKCKGKRLDNTVALSPKLCWINNFLMFFGNIVCLYVLYLQFCTADQYRCPELGFLQYLMLGSENENYVIALPSGLVILFHFLSVFLSAFVIHFNSYRSSTSLCSFLSPLECQEKEISSFVHQLEDPKNPNQAPNTDIKETKFLSQMKDMLVVHSTTKTTSL